MKITLNFSQFLDNWPESRKDQFSYNGKKALFEYFEEYEKSTGEELEFDPIDYCCEYTEYETATECACNYLGFEGMTFDEEDGHELKTAEEVEKEALEYLNDHTQVIEFDGGIIVQQF